VRLAGRVRERQRRGKGKRERGSLLGKVKSGASGGYRQRANGKDGGIGTDERGTKTGIK
jgi:hypothetical protein